MKPTAAIPTYVGKGIIKYFHGVGAKSAHYLHHPGPVLHDVGFALIPELGKARSFWSEWAFLSIVLPFVVWTFTPFVCHNKRFYTALLWPKVLVVLSMCQLFRVLSFTATQLPGPNYHCREGSPLATLPPLESIQDLFVLDVKRAGMFGCGDLIFSSHMTFTITAVLTYTKYGTWIVVKAVGWVMLIIQSALIVASRKHYTVDVVVAWYVVPLVFYFVDHYLGDSVGQGDALDPKSDRLLERTLPSPLLPVKIVGRLDGTDYPMWPNGTFVHGRSQSLDQRITSPAKIDAELKNLDGVL